MPRDRENSVLIRVDGAGLADVNGSVPGPISLWIQRPTDEPLALPSHPHDAGRSRLVHIAPPNAPDAPDADHVLDRSDAVLLPGLVNAHSHLDLTAVGPLPHDPGDGFVNWVRTVIRARPIEGERIRDAVASGVGKSLAGGVVAVGDILGAAGGRPCTAGLAALARSPLEGVGFVEFFGIGARAAEGAQALHAIVRELAAWPPGARIRPGLHPHAPNTVSLPVYEEAAALAERDGLPISTHLAETPEERAFVGAGTGPQRDLLESMGIWDDAELAHIGRGLHPVAHLAPVLARTPFVVAHVNDADDDAIATLARTRASVAYCPRASAYFGAPSRTGPHRFRDMLDGGVNICLGTDSIINLDTPDRITPLDDARLLARTTGTDPRMLIAMMTTRGALALGLDAGRYRFTREPGSESPPGGHPIAGLVAVPVGRAGRDDPAAAVLAERTPPELLFC